MKKQFTAKTIRSVAFLLICLAVLCSILLAPCSVWAAEEEEYGAKFLVGEDPSVVDVDIINFKSKLNELGFYSAGVSDTVLQSKELDDLTMAAVKLVCRLNPEFTYYEDGVTNALYWRVMGETEGPLVTPLDDEYSPLQLGSEGAGVTRVQNRLNELGYDAAAGEFTPGLYDGELQKAVEAFVACNKLVYEKDDGITAELQDKLFGDDAVPYSLEQGLGERVFTYMKGTSIIAGISIPNAVILLIGFILLCIIIVLIIKLTAKKTPEGVVENRILYLVLILIPVAAVLFLLAAANILYLLLGIIVLLVSLLVLKRQKPELFIRQKAALSTENIGPAPVRMIPPAEKTYMILSEQGGHDKQRITVDRSKYLIGRDPECNFVLSDPRIGRRHLLIKYDSAENVCYAVDQGSVNGTFLNGKRMVCGQPYRLEQGDRIMMNDRPFDVEYAYY